MTPDAPGRDDIVAEARSTFAFLEDIAAGSFAVEEGPWRTVLAYPARSITIEIELDWRENAVFVLVGRGRRPPGYYMHDGRRMRVQLTDALDGGGEQDRAAARLIREAAGRSGPDAMTTQIHAFGVILRGAMDRLEDRCGELFAD